MISRASKERVCKNSIEIAFEISLSLTACLPLLDPKSILRREAVKAGSMAIADDGVLSWLESQVESKLPTSSETPGTLQIGQSTFLHVWRVLWQLNWIWRGKALISWRTIWLPEPSQTEQAYFLLLFLLEVEWYSSSFIPALNGHPLRGRRSKIHFSISGWARPGPSMNPPFNAPTDCNNPKKHSQWIVNYIFLDQWN